MTIIYTSLYNMSSSFILSIKQSRIIYTYINVSQFFFIMFIFVTYIFASVGLFLINNAVLKANDSVIKIVISNCVYARGCLNFCYEIQYVMYKCTCQTNWYRVFLKDMDFTRKLILKCETLTQWIVMNCPTCPRGYVKWLDD